MNQKSERLRILAIALTSRGFGYAVMEGNNRIVDCGHKVISADKNNRCVCHIEKMIARNEPDVLVLSDVNAKGTHRDLRIKDLNCKVVALAKKHRLKQKIFSGTELQRRLLGDNSGTKQKIAEFLAKRFPDELALRLPPKRKPWRSEDARMDIFDAVALAVASQIEPQ